jgi:membrane-bound serine protease (ClpP class)
MRAMRARGLPALLRALSVPLGAAVLWAAAPPALAEPPAEPPAKPSRERHANIHVIDFEGEIESALVAYARRRIARAVGDEADLIVFRIESPGGVVWPTRELADEIAALRGTRTLAWVPSYAYSGAAMVAIACDDIVMAPRAHLGDAQPGTVSPEGWKPVGEKAESPIRAWVRSWAEGNGYPALLAQKMVSESLEVVMARTEDGRLAFALSADWEGGEAEEVDGIPREDLRKVRTFPKGQLLTMTASEARDYGFASRLVEDEKALLESLSAPGATVVQHAMTFSERAGRWLLGFAGVLLAVVLLGVGFTVFQGVGLVTMVGGAALVLLALVSATAELADGFPLFLLGVGVALLLVEAFLLPGFGVPGVLGILAFAAGGLFLVTGSRPWEPASIDGEAAADFGLQFVGTLLVAGALLALLARLFPATPWARRAILAEGAMPAGPAVLAPAALSRDAAAVAVTSLRPAGRATVDGALVDVVSEGGYVEAGTPLSVVRVEGTRVVVRPRA